MLVCNRKRRYTFIEIYLWDIGLYYGQSHPWEAYLGCCGARGETYMNIEAKSLRTNDDLFLSLSCSSWQFHTISLDRLEIFMHSLFSMCIMVDMFYSDQRLEKRPGLFQRIDSDQLSDNPITFNHLFQVYQAFLVKLGISCWLGESVREMFFS